MSLATVTLRSPRRRALVLGILVATALAVGATLTFEAWRASRDHRRAVERALEGYVLFASNAYRQQLLNRLYVASSAIFRPIGNTRIPRASGPLPEASALNRAANDAIRCNCGPTLIPRYVFRFDLRDGSLDAGTASIPVAARERISRMVSDLGELRERRDWDFAALYDSGADTPQLIYVAPWRDARGAPMVMYGFTVNLAMVRDSLLVPIFRNTPLIPQAPSRRLPNDSLVSLVLVDSGGRLDLPVSARQYPLTYSDAITGGILLGFLQLRLALNPVLAPQVLVGGLPPSRGPLLLGLLGLVAGVITALCVVAWRAAELARLRTEFVAGVSHELRTPLAQILLFADSLRLGRMRSRQDVETAGDVIVGESRRLIQLVENILLFGRAARGAVRMSPEPTELAPLVRDVVEFFEPQAQAVEAHVRLVQLDDVAVRVDPNGIRQVLLNLLDNAAKYGPVGQTIQVGLALVGDRARLWVEDEGPGIPDEERERVWEPFARLDRELDTNIAGSGIGLAVVREIVRQHGGTGRVESTPTRSARVVVELPGAQPRSHGPPLTVCAS